MKHIGIIVDNALDADVRVLKEIKMLQKLGVKISVLCFGFKGEEIQSYKDVSIHRIVINRTFKNLLYFCNAILPFYNLFWQKHIKKFIKAQSPDIIHTHDLYMSKPVYNATKSFKIPFVLDLHENYPVAYQSYTWTNRKLTKFITQPKSWHKKEAKYLSYPNGIITLSDYFFEKLREKYLHLDSKKHLTLPNIPDLEIFKKETTSKVPVIQFVYFGVIAQRRGVFDVLEAFHELKQNNVPCTLLFIGPIDKADKEQFEMLSNKLSKEDFQYIPWIELEDLPKYISSSHVGLAPFEKNDQHESGIANKLFQYMYCELSLLVSDCKPQKDLTETNQIGRVYTHKEELLNQMMFCTNNLELIIEEGKKAKHVLNEKYTLEPLIPKLETLYTACSHSE